MRPQQYAIQNLALRGGQGSGSDRHPNVLSLVHTRENRKAKQSLAGFEELEKLLGRMSENNPIKYPKPLFINPPLTFL